MDGQDGRARVTAVAREWIGTPFHDHAEVKGVGCDCATLLKCVFTEAGIVQPFTLDHYSPQFFLHQSEERYVGWVLKFAREIEESEARPGDIVLYRIGKCFAHGALIIEPGWPTIIHAHFAARCVRRDDGRNPRLGTRVLDRKFFSLFSQPIKKKNIA
jgi:NlpC/P60 family putative phage cell wall peptidase